MINVPARDLAVILEILKINVPECEVRAFGSRVVGTAKEYSDLDLAIVGPGNVSTSSLAKLEEAFEESDIPFRVDVLDWHSISREFQKVIEGKCEVLQKSNSRAVGGREMK